jgi:hypothetical protein
LKGPKITLLNRKDDKVLVMKYVEGFAEYHVRHEVMEGLGSLPDGEILFVYELLDNLGDRVSFESDTHRFVLIADIQISGVKKSKKKL